MENNEDKYLYGAKNLQKSLQHETSSLPFFLQGPNYNNSSPAILYQVRKDGSPLRNSYLYAHGDEASSPRPTFKRIQVPEKSKNVIEIESQDNLKLVSCITQETYRSGILNMQLKFLGDFQDWELEGVRESFQARRMKCR